MREVQSYEELEVWHAGMELVQEIYGLTERFPEDEQAGITAQMRTTAIKIPAKIAGATACDNIKIALWYLAISEGLVASLESHLKLSVRLRYVSKVDMAPIYEKCNSIGRMIEELILS